MSTTRQTGLSLIELMVALLLSGLLLLGLIQIFSASRASYSLAQGAARVQESSRFAFDYLQRDLREAGHFGCSSDQLHFQNGAVGFRELFLSAPTDFATIPSVANNEALRFDLSLYGYEAKGTGPKQTVNLGEPAPGANGDWTPALPDAIAGLSPAPVRGSDIVVLRALSPESVAVTGFTVDRADPAHATVEVDSAQWAVLKRELDAPGLFGIADCRSVALFHADSVSAGSGTTQIHIRTGGLNQSGFDGGDVFSIGQVRLHRADSFVYYVGVNAGATQPTLYRARFNAEPGSSAITVNSEALVDGVESLQLLYGLDVSASAGKLVLGRLGKIVKADEVALTASGRPEVDRWLPQLAWQRVGSLQVGMVVRSKDPASAVARGTPMLAQGTQFTAPSDGRYRSVYEVSIAARNRLSGN
jgi:type IV pilus assembly protein PilW